MAAYDGSSDPALVMILGFPVWVEILVLDPVLMTEEAVEQIGSTLKEVLHPDKNNIRRGVKSRAQMFHHLYILGKQAYRPLDFEFGVGKDMEVAIVTFKYEKVFRF